MSAAEELDKLKKLHADGTITDEQYERARAKLLEEEEAREREGHEAGRDHETGRPAEPTERAEPAKPAEREVDEEREERRPRRRRHRAPDEDEDYDRRPSPRARRKQVREWCMFLHLSLLAGHAVALGGIIAPIVIWQTKKDDMPEIDEHGKNAVNWLITWVLYMVVSLALVFVFVGIPLLIVGGVLGVVFPIIAAMKANEGEVWKYPLAIQFLK
jgi:uncharacterized Tic20 family protein